MSEKQIPGRLDGGQLDVVFDRKREHVAVPVEIRSPCFLRQALDVVPGFPAERRLVPRTRGQAGNAEVCTMDFLRRPQRLHAGKSAPRSFEPARIAVDDADIRDPLEPQAERDDQSALAAANDQHIENRHAVARLRIGPFPRRISQICQLASNPIGQLGNAHVHAFEYEGRKVRHARSVTGQVRNGSNQRLLFHIIEFHQIMPAGARVQRCHALTTLPSAAMDGESAGRPC